MGGMLALIGGFVGLVGLSTMISRYSTYGADPVGIIIFSIMLLNGLYAVYRRVTGTEEQARKSGPLSGRKRKR
ncbi:MAG TPA: hypothetical protein ENH10_00045 [Bacteroidetes bacterium]|nr:hypothetical protein BMS3Bbin04_01241 [bacterium BMS3Bbin04]HDO64411.1 hypothetical protein [Bacteroidota bacterium]HEX03536.1 hypothetical protein [Bacteroidota bacterium]